MNNSNKKSILCFSQKIALILFFAVLCSFSPVRAKKALAWDAMAANIYLFVQTEIATAIKGTMMGSLKQSAIKMLSKQADRFISGTTSNGARFITNWEDYLIDNPTRNAQRYANDYLSHALSGRGSTSYKKAKNSVLGASTTTEEGFGKGAVLGDALDLYRDEESSYAESITTMAQNTIIEPQPWQLTYQDDPKYMFETTTDGDMPNLSNFNLYLMGDGNGGNTIWDAESAIRKEYETKLENEKQVAAIESGANQGFQSDKVDGIVDKPGILYKEWKANVENMPNLAISSATSIGELIAATVSKAISSSIQKSISGVERTIDREFSKVTNKAVKEVNSTVNEYGPGALYKN